MDFFYPNWGNDMWRIWGYLAKNDKNFFVLPNEKRFDKDKIEQFCIDYGIALFDTAEEVVRLKGNASDNFLQIVRPTNVAALLEQLPECHTIVATGQKSAETLQATMGLPSIAVGECVKTVFNDRKLTIWRMPSSSRAYPRPIEWKAQFYKKVMDGESFQQKADDDKPPTAQLSGQH